MGDANWHNVPVGAYRRALEKARRYEDHVASAYLRLALAAIDGSGVRLTADEVAHLAGDHAIAEAAACIAALDAT